MRFYEGPVYSNGIQGEVDEPNPEHVRICKAWLEMNARPRHTINYRHSSYELKHAVESALRGKETMPWSYVTNGAFIRAAIDLGYKCVPCGPMSPNVYLAISFEPLRRFQTEERRRVLANLRLQSRKLRGAR